MWKLQSGKLAPRGLHIARAINTLDSRMRFGRENKLLQIAQGGLLQFATAYTPKPKNKTKNK